MKLKNIFIILLILCCTSCGTSKYITQVQHDTTTIYKNINTIQHDSIYVFKDRVIYTKGDTVYVNTVEYKDRLKIKEVHDTTFRENIVYIDKEVPVEVEKKLTKTQKLFISSGKLFCVLLLFGLGYIGIKIFRKLK